MRKIEEQMLQAIEHRKNWKSGNTEVVRCYCAMKIYLHGSHIATWCDGRSYADGFSLCGYNTTTTRSRLRALGIDVRKRNGAAYCNGKEINAWHWYHTDEL